MSIELPEAYILAKQMDKELRGKHIKSYRLEDYERLQKLGFVNDRRFFDQFVNGKIESVTSRGNVMRAKFDNGMNLVLGPEYGGIVLYHKSEKSIVGKFHLRIDFTDSTVFTVRLTGGFGVIQAFKDNDLEKSYVYRRDFSEVLSPLNDKEFTSERFSKLLSDNNVMIKTVLVGKDAIVVGLGNSAFQDIIYRAKIHPKRKASELSKDERQALYDAIRHVVQERIRLGGKDQFLDLFGKQGGYVPAMGSNMKEQNCPLCGTPIEKMNLGGGHTYYCPKCQK